VRLRIFSVGYTPFGDVALKTGGKGHKRIRKPVLCILPLPGACREVMAAIHLSLDAIHNSARAITTHALVISFAAPTTSPLTPPNIFWELTRRIVGQMIMTSAAATSWRGVTGRNTRGRHNIRERKGKYGLENV